MIKLSGNLYRLAISVLFDNDYPIIPIKCLLRNKIIWKIKRLSNIKGLVVHRGPRKDL